MGRWPAGWGLCGGLAQFGRATKKKAANGAACRVAGKMCWGTAGDRLGPHSHSVDSQQHPHARRQQSIADTSDGHSWTAGSCCLLSNCPAARTWLGAPARQWLTQEWSTVSGSLKWSSHP